MRLASFNVENLFQRARALDATDWDAGRPVLERQARLNAILGEAAYSATDKTQILDLLGQLGLSAADVRLNPLTRRGGHSGPCRAHPTSRFRGSAGTGSRSW
jgi:hypothetical protein